MTSRRRPLLLAAAAGAAAAGGLLAVRAVERRWSGAAGSYGPDEARVPDGEESTVVTDDGAELAVVATGPEAGPMVILAHCWTGSRDVWGPVAHRLVRRGHRVVLYDQRGHGASSVGRDGFTIPRLGGDLRAVLEAVDAHDAVLAGHSMGGMTVQSLAVHHPDVVAGRARALVLVSTAAGGLGRGAPGANAVAARMVGSPLLERAMRGRFGHALVRGAVGRSVVRDHLVLTRDLFVACPSDARSGWLTAMLGMDLRDGITGISLPTTVVVGTRDGLTPAPRAAELVDAIDGADLVTLDGFGHMLPLEAPDEVADAIARAFSTERDAMAMANS